VSISTLADRLEWSPGHVSRTVSELEAYGYVQTKQRGRQKLVSLTDIEPIEQLEGLLTEYTHMDLPGLIAGSGLQILYYFEQGRTATELAEQSGVSPQYDKRTTTGKDSAVSWSVRLNKVELFTQWSPSARGQLPTSSTRAR
jgi:DNA-binding transcriptional MocR family regulator